MSVTDRTKERDRNTLFLDENPRGSLCCLCTNATLEKTGEGIGKDEATDICSPLLLLWWMMFRTGLSFGVTLIGNDYIVHQPPRQNLSFDPPRLGSRLLTASSLDSFILYLPGHGSSIRFGLFLKLLCFFHGSNLHTYRTTVLFVCSWPRSTCDV